ncbi:hypothetical protein [Pandoraea sp.]|uniref:hypothetical protein n=1 Tax=Pandoraea sp. TaxID=1883445 RepID=UPI00120C5719|nr:hypothetical protein [Pandoraea sp.]TAL53661.1 MAG: hypothetical protein EPN80_15390 [Pandoraea sp.]TAM14796.1 MAG: hypothetical protein EPN65_19650 [Pandoraea sp.]
MGAPGLLPLGIAILLMTAFLAFLVVTIERWWSARRGRLQRHSLRLLHRHADWHRRNHSR